MCFLPASNSAIAIALSFKDTFSSPSKITSISQSLFFELGFSITKLPFTFCSTIEPSCANLVFSVSVIIPWILSPLTLSTSEILLILAPAIANAG